MTYKLDVGGNGFSIGCTECDFERYFSMGFSVFDHRFENHVSFMEEEDKARISEILENHRVESTKHDKPIYRCVACGEVEMKRYVRMIYDDGSIFETHAYCPRCGKLMEVVRHVQEITSLKCPECRDGRIKFTGAMIWD